MRNKGFTFIEVTLVAALLGVVGVVLASVMANGLDIWQRVNAIAAEEDVVVFFDKFTGDVSNAILFKKTPLEGDGTSVSVPSIVSSGDGAGLPGVVRYYFNGGKRRLERREDDYRLVSGKKSSKDVDVLVEDVRHVRFTYYAFDPQKHTYLWYDGWGSGLPQAVRVEMDVKYGEKEKKYVRTIDIPVRKIERKEG